MNRCVILAGVVAATVAASAWAGEPPVRIVDGDGLTIGELRVRLWGIDAPELDQTCERGGSEYACGVIAREVLRGLVADDKPACRTVNRDRYGRIVARCTVAGHDLGSMMVNAGWAVDYRRYSSGTYQLEQERAQDAGRGLWGGIFVPPWEWRKQTR